MHNDWRLHNSPCRDVDSFRFFFLTNISRIFDLMKLSFCGRSSKSVVFHYIAVSCFSAFLSASRPRSREWNWLSHETRRSEKYCNFIKTSNRLGERVHAGCCELHACEWERGEICRWQRVKEVWKQFNSIDLRRALQRLIEEKNRQWSEWVNGIGAKSYWKAWGIVQLPTNQPTPNNSSLLRLRSVMPQWIEL